MEKKRICQELESGAPLTFRVCKAVYEDEDSHHHHHLICAKCGRVMSFQGDLLEEFEKKMEEKTGFRIQDHDVKLYGHCADCLKKSKREIK